MKNRLANCKNPYQGSCKKILWVCSAGLLRSPTAALVLSQEPFNFNTRAVGCDEEFALIPVDEVLIAWADEIVCMEERHAQKLAALFGLDCMEKLKILSISDNYNYRNEELIELIKERYNNAA